MTDFPADLKYTKDHEWAKATSGEIQVGITKFAVEQLGDITLVNFDVKEGDTIAEGKAFGTIESVKSVSDLFAPIAGKIVRLNKELEGKPELVNEDPYGKGWMIVIAPSKPDEVNGLLTSGQYEELLKEGH